MSYDVNYEVMYKCFVKEESSGSYSPCTDLEGKIELKSQNGSKPLICEGKSIYLGTTNISDNKSQLDECIVEKDCFTLKNSKSDFYFFKVCNTGKCYYVFGDPSTIECKLDLTGYPNEKTLTVNNPYAKSPGYDYYHCGWNSEVYKYDNNWDDFSKKRSHLINNFPVFNTEFNYDVIYVCQKVVNETRNTSYGYVIIQITNNGWKIWLSTSSILDSCVNGYQSSQNTLPISNNDTDKLKLDDGNCIIEISNKKNVISLLDWQ